MLKTGGIEVCTSDKLDVEPHHSIVLDFVPPNCNSEFNSWVQ